MPFEIAAMVLVSAVLHPTWNAFLKREEDRAAGYWAMGIFFALYAGTYSWVGGHDLTDGLDVFWPFIVFSWAGQVIYGAAMVAVYRRGDFSAYYPIIRSSPVFVVLFGLVALKTDYAPALLGGIAMVVVGAFLLQYRPGTRLLSDPLTLLLAVVSMCGTGIYSIADAGAVQSVPPSVLFFWIELGLLPLYAVVFRLVGQGAVERRAVRLLMWRPLRYAGAAAIAFIGYVLILEAYARGGDVAAVTAVRQASIPLSALIGGLVLKESHLAMRLVASLVMAAGIVVVILSG